ncbi:hypothetical protein KPA93_27825 [Burkholderia cenocepacia]|uniref:hypothetical protein n=1 Tax=Burkholderia cenocepacia TaxID=95486 RepID=UPI002866D2A2|nr:hypothetical protein [Burkholderia cenocepacia]MDR8027029.1 hypothetical protein [Burkholderia cenocepacia]MDR8044281.1 hypothetical protein [Burkholderia cenocepacia]
MSDPILTPEEVWAISQAVVPSFSEWTASCQEFAAAIEAAVMRKVLGEVACYGTRLPSGKFHAFRATEADADHRTAMWNSRYPRPPHAETVPLYALTRSKP